MLSFDNTYSIKLIAKQTLFVTNISHEHLELSSENVESQKQ